MIKKIAVDIVLLPPSRINDLAFDLNKLTDQTKVKFGKDKEDAIPHISLAMGFMNVSDLPEMSKQLGLLPKKHFPLDLKLNGSSGGAIEGEGYIWGINIERNGRIQALHEEVMKILKKYSDTDSNAVAFAGKGLNIENAIEWSKEWVKGYEEHSSYDKFSPHITIGFGKDESVENLEFQASVLAVCQLGPYCTCRKILGSHR